jgi:hypothetical protein
MHIILDSNTLELNSSSQPEPEATTPNPGATPISTLVIMCSSDQYAVFLENDKKTWDARPGG